MPTDGADFQRRRPLYGRFFVDLKQGASDKRLVASGVAGIAREITKGRQLPMLKPVVDALVAIRPEQNLLARDSESLARSVLAAIKGAIEQLPASGVTRDLESLMLRAAVRLADRNDLDEGNYRSALFSEAGFDLFAEKVCDPAGEALLVHRGLHPDKLGERKQSLCRAAQPAMTAMLRSVYDSPRGVPARCFLNPDTAGPMIAAGIPDSGAHYSFDVLSKGIPRTLHDARGLAKLSSLAWRLRCCSADNPARSFMVEFPEWVDLSTESASALGLSKDDFRQQFIALQLRFMREWNTFVAAIPQNRRSPLPAAA